MNKIELVALDMDGTACVFQEGVLTENIDPIIATQAKGVKVVFATGRPILTSLQEALKVKMDYYHQYFIGFNGACIYDIKNNQIVHEQTIPSATLEVIFALAAKHQIKIWCYTNDLTKVIVNFDPILEANTECVFFNGEFEQYNPNNALISEDGYKCLGFDLTDDHPFVVALTEGHNIEIAIDKNGVAEINAPGINKLLGLRWVTEEWGIELENVMAMGDSMNDYHMLKNVGVGIAMGNAQDAVKAIAKEVTSDAKDGGVAKMLNKYILNSEI
ncbi:Cof-type HAD-IIB family hydrolase [Spiroplasma chrysopicola]|uniref:HAD family hydrolase n=1 Tax=Spiroplasma chrysopicola DF-1 TaxID=1276227 RepID=R4UHS8_9MOLU|nr:Cof-type HAD-IIB family hydrolase [Spiroplasma chrysopicola]AGM24881.1 HAD family hydrolase [Spiroplasma chrysopicola DF-1]